MIRKENTNAVLEVLTRITSAWRSGHPEGMAPALDEGIVMAFPGFVDHMPAGCVWAVAFAAPHISPGTRVSGGDPFAAR